MAPAEHGLHERHAGRRRPIVGSGVAIALAVVLIGCAGSPSTSESPASQPSGPVNASSDVPARQHWVYQPMAVGSNRGFLRSDRSYGFDFQSDGPLEFLDFLVATLEEGSSPFTLNGIHVGWIEERDLPQLAEKLDSTTPCRGVMLSTSSFISNQVSTVGHEAAWLILGFQSERDATGYGGYPPSLLSTQSLHSTAIEDARAWWAAYQAER